MADPVDLSGYHLSFDAEMTNVSDLALFSNTFYNGDVTIVGNSEAETYVPAASNPGTYSLSGGALSINATPNASGGYSSGLLSTAGSFSQNQGYFEIRAIVAPGTGFWSAFWLLAADYSAEVDIVEQPNNDGAQNYFSSVKTAQYNAGSFQNGGADLSTAYHTYGFMWTANTVQFTMDGNYIGYAAATPAAMATVKLYILANLAVGGYGSWPGQPATGAISSFSIDYIRAYSNDPSVPTWSGTEQATSPDQPSTGTTITPVTGASDPATIATPDAGSTPVSSTATGNTPATTATPGAGSTPASSTATGNTPATTATPGAGSTPVSSTVTGNTPAATATPGAGSTPVSSTATGNTPAATATPGADSTPVSSTATGNTPASTATPGADSTPVSSTATGNTPATIATPGAGSTPVSSGNTPATIATPGADSTPVISTATGNTPATVATPGAGSTPVSSGNTPATIATPGADSTPVISTATGNTPATIATPGASSTPLISTATVSAPVYRFFDTSTGTQFLTSSASERASVLATRPDFTSEGVGLNAVVPTASDTSAAAIYRFFDDVYGTHFYTTSTTERDSIMASRADLTYEGVGFYDYTVKQTGNQAVYRFFESTNGTHFYTESAAEQATILSTRPDLIPEGVAFYTPGSK